MAQRTEFLESIRSRLEQYKPTHAPDSPWTERPQPAAPAASAPEDLPARFLDELRLLGGHGECVADLDGARAYILDLARQRGAKSLIRWRGLDLEALGVDGPLTEAGVSVYTWEQAESLWEEVARADIGLAEAELAVAETGSLLLSSGPGAGRSVTLLPPTFVATVQAEKIVPRVADAIHHYAALGNLPSSLTFHTGPSRSADIEQTLSIGVHGPGDVHVLIIG